MTLSIGGRLIPLEAFIQSLPTVQSRWQLRRRNESKIPIRIARAAARVAIDLTAEDAVAIAPGELLCPIDWSNVILTSRLLRKRRRTITRQHARPECVQTL